MRTERVHHRYVGHRTVYVLAIAKKIVPTVSHTDVIPVLRVSRYGSVKTGLIVTYLKMFFSENLLVFGTACRCCCRFGKPKPAEVPSEPIE